MADQSERETAWLYYGPSLSFEVDRDMARQVCEEVGAHATRGGWVSFTDVRGKVRTLLITPGIPIWLESDTEITR